MPEYMEYWKDGQWWPSPGTEQIEKYGLYFASLIRFDSFRKNKWIIGFPDIQVRNKFVESRINPCLNQ